GEQKMHVEEFAEDRMVIVASPEHPLARKKEVTYQDLENQNWILREKGSGTREATERLFQQYDLSPSNLIHFGSTQPIKEVVAAGMGISLLSEWAVNKELHYGDLQ